MVTKTTFNTVAIIDQNKCLEHFYYKDMYFPNIIIYTHAGYTRPIN